MHKLIGLLLIALLSACGGGGTSGSNVSNCTLKAYDSTYPNSYLGSNNIPSANQKFISSVMRGMGLKDYYPHANNNCSLQSDYARLLYKKTLDRLQDINVDTVEIYQYGPVNDFTASTWVADESKWQIPKSELKWFVEEAHSRNIKVTLLWQLWSVDSKGNQIKTVNPTESEMVTVLRGWHDIILSMAKISNEFNIDNLNIQWSAFGYSIVSTYSETATQEFLSIISDIRKVYNGKLFIGTPRFYDNRIIEKVDGIVVSLTPSNWSYYDNLNISVGLLKQRYMDAIDGIYLDFSLYSNMDVKNIPIIWDFNIQSRDRALLEGWVEDGFCITPTSNGAPVSYDNPLCIQKNYVTDFSVQALAIEGAFEAISAQSYFNTKGVNFSTSYWHTDTLTPGPEGFPNLSQSIRGKPAEKIVKYWFSKI